MNIKMIHKSITEFTQRDRDFIMTYVGTQAPHFLPFKENFSRGFIVLNVLEEAVEVTTIDDCLECIIEQMNQLADNYELFKIKLNTNGQETNVQEETV